MSKDSLRQLLRRAAEAGAALTRKHFRTAVEVEEKARGDLVSRVDRASEKVIHDLLMQAAPGASFLGEESGWQPGGDPVFIVDPLDGTTNYLRGVPCYSVAIGVLRRGRPVAGIILAPELDLVYEAQRGEGAYRNGRLITTTPRRLGPASLVAVPSVFGPRLLRASRRFVGGEMGKIRRLGSAALELAMVAEGAFDACLFDRTYLWDIAAGWLLVREAGGRCGLMGGGRLFPLGRQALGRLAGIPAGPAATSRGPDRKGGDSQNPVRGSSARAGAPDRPLSIWASNGRAQVDLPWPARGD